MDVNLFFINFCRTGCSGGLNGLSAALPKQVCEVFSLAQKKDWDNATKVQKQLIMADQVVSGSDVPNISSELLYQLN